MWSLICTCTCLMPCKDFVLPIQGMQVSCTEVVQILCWRNDLHIPLQGSKNPCAVTRNLPAHPVHLSSFSRNAGKQIKPTEQHTRAVRGLRSTQQNKFLAKSGVKSKASGELPLSLPGTCLRAAARAPLRAPQAQPIAGQVKEAVLKG